MIRHLLYSNFSYLTVVLFGFALLMGGSVEGQTQIFVEDFEDATITYSPSVSEFTDESGDYFIRTNETNIGSAFTVSNIQDSYYFGAQDLDGEGATLPLFLNFDNIGIAGYSSLTFKVYLAEDDDGTNEDWDAADYVHIGYDIDNTGSYSELLWIESSAGTNTEPFLQREVIWIFKLSLISIQGMKTLPLTILKFMVLLPHQVQPSPTSHSHQLHPLAPMLSQ
jgi:hypothetical protein